jgi:putative hydrolase of the HAD superfamily
MSITKPPKPKYIFLDIGKVIVKRVQDYEEGAALELGVSRENFTEKLIDYIDNHQSEEMKSMFENIRTYEDMKKYYKRFHTELLPMLGFEPSGELIEKMFEYRCSKYALVDDALETLNELVKEYKLVAITGAFPSRRVHEFEELGLIKYFEFALITSEEGLSKSEPYIYKKALERLNADPKDVMFIDDKIKYLEGARKAGIENLVLVNPKEPAQDYFQISALKDILELLK